MSWNFSEINDWFSLFRLAFTVCNILGHFLGYIDIFTLQFHIQILNHLEERFDKHEAYFVNDQLFGLLFSFILDQHLQQFLQGCTHKPSIDSLDSSHYDLSHILRSIQHNRFYCNLPVILSTQSLSPSKVKPDKSISKDNGDAELFNRNSKAWTDWVVLVTKI